VSELHLTADEAGSMEFPFVAELLEYWLEYPPEQLLLRMMSGYKRDTRSARKQRADEMGDTTYVPEKANKRTATEEERQAINALGGPTGARHLDCAPTHIQEAIARAQRGDHLKIPQ